MKNSIKEFKEDSEIEAIFSKNRNILSYGAFQIREKTLVFFCIIPVTNAFDSIVASV